MKREEAKRTSEIARYLDREPSDFTAPDLVRYVFENGVRLVTLSPVTGDGKLKTLTFPVSTEKRLYETLERGERVDGSSHFRYLAAEKSDLYIVPRFRTAFMNPFSGIPNLVIISSCFDASERPFSHCPQRLVAAADRAFNTETGASAKIMGELEFYLLGPGEHIGVQPDRLYQESTPFVRFQHVRDEIMLRLTEIGVPVKYAHAEVGGKHGRTGLREQHEIEMLPESPESAADSLVKAKWVVRNVAASHGLVATFAPKIDVNLAGSGMHFHFQVLKKSDNLLFDGKGSVSDNGMAAIGGLLELTPSLTAFANTVPTSYLRFTAGQEAPTSLSWGETNRSTLIRIPLGWGGGRSMAREANPGHRKAPGAAVDRRTVELRLPDGSANVHQTVAAILVGLRRGLADPSLAETARKLETDASGPQEEMTSAPALPRSCWESANLLEHDRVFYEDKDVFPPSLLDSVVRELRLRGDRDLADQLRGSSTRMSELVEEYFHCG